MGQPCAVCGNAVDAAVCLVDGTKVADFITSAETLEHEEAQPSLGAQGEADYALRGEPPPSVPPEFEPAPRAKPKRKGK